MKPTTTPARFILPALALLILILLPGMGWGQQVIGSFPEMRGGFEEQSSIASNSSISANGAEITTEWTTSSTTSVTATITATGGRSGPHYATYGTTASSAVRLQSPTVTTSGAINNATAYTVQFFYRTSGTTAATNFQRAISPDGTSQPGTYGAYTLTGTNNVWTLVQASQTSGTSSSTTKYGVAIIRANGISAVNIDIDDFVIYAGSADNTAPNAPGTVTVNNATETSLDVSWGAASGGVDGGGYVVVRYASDPGTGNDPNQNGIYAVGNTVSTGGTVRFIGTGTSFTDNVGLSSGTPYWYKVYTVDKAFNYSTESSASGSTTSPAGSISSDIIGAGNESGNIGYSSNQSGSIATTSDAVRVFSFTIRDGGASADGDALPTILSSITFDKGTNNGVTSWASTIREAALFDGSTKVAEISVSGETIAFTGLSGSNVTAADNGTKTLDLYLTFESTVTDNQQLQFQIQSANVANAASGSSSFTSFSAVASSVAGDANRIEVTATKLAFVQQPSNVAVNNAISPVVTVAANDDNNNRDLDYTTDNSITASGAVLSGSPVVATPSSGLATFSALTFTTTGSGVTLTVSSGSLANAQSNIFTISQPPSAGEIVINQFSPDYNGASDEYIELLNKTNKSFDLSLLKIEYQSTAGSGSSAGGSLSGTLGPYQYWLISPNANITVGLTSALARDGSFAAGFAAAGGQIALRLKDSPNTIIDGLAYGPVTVNNLGEGTASAAPATDGGLLRSPDGSDNNDNSTDFTTISQANIYLRNSSSYNFSSSYTLPVTSYSADIVISGSSTDVILSGNTTITGKLTVLAGSLAIGSTQQLTVSGTLTNSAGNGGLVIKSDADGTGSLIHSTPSVPATVERYINNNGFWHFVASPVTAQEVWPQFAPTPSALSFGAGPWNWDFYYWNPNADTTTGLFWVNLRKTDGTYNDGTIDEAGNAAGFGAAIPTMTPGRGYLAAYVSDWTSTTHTFTGNLNEGSVTRALSITANKFNLAGNPYPSSIDWKASSGWDFSKLTLNGSGYDYWIYNNSTGNYGVFNSAGTTGTNGTSRYIAPGQAFFVQAATAGNLSMNDNVRAHSSQAWLKEANTENGVLRLQLTTNASDYSDEMLVAFDPASAPGGSEKLMSIVPEAPEMWSPMAGKYYSIARYTQPTGDLVVPVSVKAGTDAGYTLTATNISDFSLAGKVYLEDTKTGATQELRSNPAYAFNAAPGDAKERFRLHFGEISGTGASHIQTPLSIWVTGGTVHVANPAGLNGTVIISNILGQEILRKTVSGTSAEISVNGPSGYYIVSVVTNQQTTNRKILIR